MTFEFDPTLSATQNIEKFYKHLESIDPEFAGLLKLHLPPILPLPEVSSVRTASRQRFNEAVLKHLDQEKVGPAR